MNEIKEKALKVEIFDKARDYAKDKNKVNAYLKWENCYLKQEENMGKI